MCHWKPCRLLSNQLHELTQPLRSSFWVLCDEWTTEGQRWNLEDKLEVYGNTTMVDWDVMVTVVGEKWLDSGHVWKAATDLLILWVKVVKVIEKSTMTTKSWTLAKRSMVLSFTEVKDTEKESWESRFQLRT